MQGVQQLAQKIRALQLPQIGRVGRADVDGDIIRDLINCVEGCEIVRNCIFDCDAAGLADVHAKNAIRPAPFDILRHLHSATVVETKPINERAIAWQTKDAWPRISGLWLARDCTYFDETKTQGAQRLSCCSVLIKASRQPNWISKLEAKTVQLAKELTLKSLRNQLAHGLITERY